jgi:L-ascorbate metabolism protein UlaG (beta-lactamase superfamily)
MELTWHGHSFFEIDCGEKKLFIDPFLEGNSSCDIGMDSIQTGDFVFVTHGHEDHYGEALKICKKTNATLISNYEITTMAEEDGVSLTEPMNIGGGIQKGPFTIRMTEAQHSSGPGMGHPAGFVISYKDICVYHAGDTGLFSDMKLIGDLYNPDLAMLPVGDRFTMGPTEAAKAAGFLAVQQVIPMHYNTFEYIEQTAEEITRRLEKKTEVIILKPGDTHLLIKNND